MPRSLNVYIAGVVTLSAIALAVATLVFPPDQRVAVSIPKPSGLAADSHAAIEMALGVAFWTALTLIASALPVSS